MLVKSSKSEKNYNSQKIKFANDIVDLKNIKSSNLRPNDLVIVINATNQTIDGGAIFYWNSVSVANGNDGTIVKPNDVSPSDMGRWTRSIVT